MSEPWIEAEDTGCSCNNYNKPDEDGNLGVESEWEWEEDQGCYVCTGCGEVQ